MLKDAQYWPKSQQLCAPFLTAGGTPWAGLVLLPTGPCLLPALFPSSFGFCPHQQAILVGKREYVNMDFGEIVLVRSVTGQKLIKRNKRSVLSQARIRRAQGSVSSGDTLRLVLLAFRPSQGKYGGTHLRGFGFYFSSHFKICISIHAVQHSCSRKDSCTGWAQGLEITSQAAHQSCAKWEKL